MRQPKSTLAILVLIVLSALTSDVIAQQPKLDSFVPKSAKFDRKYELPAGLNDNSTIQEILEYLNQTTFPYAYVGLKEAGGPTRQRGHISITMADTFRQTLIFSKGFKLVGDGGCHLSLINNDAKLLNLSSDDLPDGEPSTRGIAPPHAAEFAGQLETVSYDKGKSPFLHTKNPDKARLLGSWRTEFTSRGFFKRSVFGIKFPIKENHAQTHYISRSTATFTFDDRAMSERFNAAFRLLIKQCQPLSTKPRWHR